MSTEHRVRSVGKYANRRMATTVADDHHRSRLRFDVCAPHQLDAKHTLRLSADETAHRSAVDVASVGERQGWSGTNDLYRSVTTRRPVS